MLCPHCGDPLRESKKSTDYLLCDTCKKKIRVENAISEEDFEEPKKSHIGIIIIGIVLAVLIALLVICLIYFNKGRSGKNQEGAVISEDSENEELNTKSENSYTIDGITITANNFSIEPYEDPEGQYTKQISVHFTFQNDTDNAFGYISSIDGYLSDGYKLESYNDLSDMDLQQIPSHSSKDMTAYLLADDSVELNEIEATYNFMDYDEEYWDDLGKILTGEMGQEEYLNKYNNTTELTFTVTAE